MAKRRFGSFLVYLIGLLVVVGAAFTGVRLWHDKDAQLGAAREAMAEGLAKGPGPYRRRSRHASDPSAPPLNLPDGANYRHLTPAPRQLR